MHVTSTLLRRELVRFLLSSYLFEHGFFSFSYKSSFAFIIFWQFSLRSLCSFAFSSSVRMSSSLSSSASSSSGDFLLIPGDHDAFVHSPYFIYPNPRMDSASPPVGYTTVFWSCFRAAFH